MTRQLGPDDAPHTAQVPADPPPTPSDIATVVDPYRTCEFATVTKAGVPIAWPTVTLYDVDGGVFTVTTSVALPTKAVNVRREPRVSMLFSDPTGSGSATLPQVLVRGRASCPDVVRADPAGLEDYWARLYARQPAGRIYGANPLTRALMDWYYFRLVITVVPESVEVRDPVAADERLPPAPVAGGGVPARIAAELAHYRSDVVTWIAPDGGPASTRVRPTVGTAGGLLLADNLDLTAGPASLLCHAHDDRLWSQRSFVAVGSLERTDGRWAFMSERFIEGSSTSPLRALRMFREARATTRRYLARRGLSRPAVAWADFAALHPTARCTPPRVERAGEVLTL